MAITAILSFLPAESCGTFNSLPFLTPYFSYTGTNMRRSISLAILAIVAITGCSKQPTANQTKQTPVVLCVNAVSQELTDFDEFLGRTESSETVLVQARVSGFLESIEFKEGEPVQQGDLLATIESEEYDAIHKQSLANIKLWESRLALAEVTFGRYKELLAKNSVSQSEYDESQEQVFEAQSQVDAAKAESERTALDLKYTQILAPISGRADRALVTPGNMLTGGLGQGTALTTIVKDTPMFAYIDVDELALLNYKRRVQEAGGRDEGVSLKDLKIPCFLQLQDEADYPHEGYLDFAGNSIDSATGTIRLRGVFDNQDHLLQGGLFVRVKIPSGEPYQGTLIPEQCIALDQADRIAYVVNSKNEVEMRKLELGARFGDMRAIRSGISEGDRVIYQGMQMVRPGMVVDPQDAELPTAFGGGSQANNGSETVSETPVVTAD